MITYLLNTLVDSIKTSLINKLGLDPSTEVDLDDFPQLIDDIPILDSVEELTVTQNGTYTGTDGVTYNPVNVNLPLDTKTITANGTYNASDDSLQGYSSVTVDIDDTDLYRDTTDSTYESVKTLSNCGAFPMLSLTAEINAVQDLHGYDHPWVGGAGKNKMPPLGSASGNGITMTTDNDGNTIFNGTVESGVSFDAYVDLPSALTGNYVLSINNSQTIAPTYLNTFIALFNGSTRTHATLMNEQNTKVVVTNETITRFFIRFQAGLTVTNFKISVQLEEGSTATSYEPYSNICPISGWDEVNVNVSGINVWDEEWEVGAISNSNGVDYALAERVRSKNYIIVKPNTPYYLYLPNTYSNARIACYDKDKTYLGQATGWLSVNNNTAFTTPSNTYCIRFVVVKTDETYNNDISINYPSTDTEYHAYNGQTHTTALSTTCYGGSKDIKGNERFTHGHIASYNGETLPSTWISDRDEYAEGTTPTIGAEVVYELATPTTATSDAIDLTLAEGVNNLWADSGDVGDARYFREVEL